MRVAMSSPVDMTRARNLSLISPIRWMPEGHLPQLDEMPLEVGPDRDTEVAGQVGVTPLDLLHHRLPFAGQRLRQQLLKPVGDPGERRVHHDRAQTLVQARAHDVRYVLPVADARDTGAAELEDDPEGIGIGCHRAVPGAAPG